MQRVIRKLDAASVVAEYPLDGLLAGWFFRVREVSQGAWLAEGTDLWGRLVSHQGAEPEALLSQCVVAAKCSGG